MIDLTKVKEMSVREIVWLEAWIATARADNCNDKTVPTVWADRCLKDFDERFVDTIKR